MDHVDDDSDVHHYLRDLKKCKATHKKDFYDERKFENFQLRLFTLQTCEKSRELL